MSQPLARSPGMVIIMISNMTVFTLISCHSKCFACKCSHVLYIILLNQKIMKHTVGGPI